MDLVSGALLAAALIGALLRAHRTWWLPAGWHPVLVLSAWSLIVLLAGIAGSLRAGVVLVITTGLAAGAYEIVRHRDRVLSAVRAPAYLALAVTGLVLAALLQQRVVTHYDNFSHWALVVKVMLETGALPSTDTPVVAFTTYPLGASALAYLFRGALGGAESAAMLGHSLWVASTALPLVTAAGRRVLPGLALYAVGALILLTMIHSPTSLLVDALVAGLASCLLLLVILHSHELQTAPWPFALLAAALLMVKSSGALFVVVATVVLILAALVRTRVPRRQAASLFAAAAVPWGIWWAWTGHVARTFPEPESAKHSVSVQRFEQVLGEKSPEDVRTILSSFGGSVLTDGTTLLALLALVAAGALAARSGAIDVRVTRGVVLLTVLTVGAWELALGLMYLLSMPLGEALVLAGFARYQGTIRLFVLLITLSLLAGWFAHRSRWSPRTLVALGIVLLLPLALAASGLRSLGTLSSKEQPRLEVSAGLQTADPRVGPQDEVCLLQPERDGGYRTWMVRYLTLNNSVRPRTLSKDAESLSGADTCDVVLLLDPRPRTADVVRKAGFDLPDGTPVPVAVRR